MPGGFYCVVAAQFVSAFADNALLIIAIARLIELGSPGWWAPLLKFWFTISYVLLAPWVGQLADAMPKGRLMAWMNGLKFIGAALMLTSVPPLIAFAIVGVAAAAYAPAKYGIITELLPAQKLVAANAWIEVSVVCAVLCGTVAGGVLVSSWFTSLPAAGVAERIASSISESSNCAGPAAGCRARFVCTGRRTQPGRSGDQAPVSASLGQTAKYAARLSPHHSALMA